MTVGRAEGRAAALFFSDIFAGFLALGASIPCTKAAGSLLGLQEAAATGGIGSFQDLFLPASLIFATAAYAGTQGHYRLVAPWWQQVGHILSACLMAFALSALVETGWKTSAHLLHDVLLWVLVPLCMISGRWLVRSLLLKNGAWAIPTVVAGGAKSIPKCLAALAAETYLVYDVRQLILSDAGAAEAEAFSQKYPGAAVSSHLDLASVAESYIIFCPDNMHAEGHQRTLVSLEASGLRFAYIPPVDSYFLYNAEPRRFFGYGIIALESRRSAPSKLGRLVKDGFDRLGAAIGLVLLSPLFLFIAWMIRKDGGPAIYGHRRIGKDSRPFTCLKFRSMVVNSKQMLDELLASDPAARAEYERDFKLKNDPRVTKIGKFLRKTSLDELPQLLNVLRGEMSLMGPRPIVEDEKKYYEETLKDYASVRPGMTGLWQVSGRSDTGYAQRVYLDGWYVKNWSFWNDLIIILRTVVVVMKRKGAY